jgi:carbamoyltransferase
VNGLRAERIEDAPAQAACLLAAGGLVGWFDGNLEFGPRALGHRSILTDPRRRDVRDELNRRIKHREEFRPFAAAVLDGHAREWFDMPAVAAAPSRELMLFAYPVRADCRDLIPAVIHRDGTCRIQTVRVDRDLRFHCLLSEFHRLTGVPLVLNTSFNDSEPIVLSPADAVATFLSSGLDALFLGDFRVCR